MAKTRTTTTTTEKTRSSTQSEGISAMPLDSIKQTIEPVVGMEALINAADIRSRDAIQDEIKEDEFNPIVKDEVSFPEVPDVLVFDRVEVPVIRKVVIKKIDRFTFKLGLERSNEKHKIMPGVGHYWAPAKKGSEFVTGLEDMPTERKRLESLLRVDLSATSDYYATLSFRMEDKEHGQIMNFDDYSMGAYYEVVYYAMLASDLIANGLHEYKSGKKPFAEWYIENKDAEAELGQADMTAEIEATNAFPALSYSKRMDIGKLLGLPVWGLSDKAASKDLWDFIRKSAINAREFNKLAGSDNTEFNVRVLVKTAVKFNVIRRNRTNEYVFGTEVLGPTEDHVVVRLASAANATLRMAIDRQLKAKL